MFFYVRFTKNEKMIAILPTWRRKIAGRIDPITGVRVYNNIFKDSEYYNYYNNLINDKRLLKTFKKYNYKGLFVVHPSHYANAGDFEGNEFVKELEGVKKAQQENMNK